MKLKYFFHKDRATSSPNTTSYLDGTSKPAFKPKSTFTPPVSNAVIDTFCKLVDKDIEALYKSMPVNKSSNCTKSQQMALSSLAKNNNVIFKSADKGGGLVSMNRTDYEQEVLRQLSDELSYTKLTGNPTASYKREIDNFIHEGYNKQYLTSSERDYLISKNPTIPVIYILPKVHKSFTKFPAGRPIVSSNGSLTEPLSTFIDAHIRPLVEGLPSYLRDTGHFIDTITGIDLKEDDILLVTMDVTSLYTNIPHDIGLIALESFLDTRLDCSPPTSFLRDMAKLVLTKNYFLFNNDYFLQVRGTAMGATFAPDYANLFMGFLERKHIHTNNPFADNIILYKRYIDDLFLIWRGTEAELSNFHCYMNNLVDSINFSLEYDSNKIHFLDTWAVRDTNRLYTTLYRKPTDKNSCLHAKSFHPEPSKKGLPYSQFLRIRRICLKDEDFHTESLKMRNDFIKRGYPKQCLDDALARAKATSDHNSQPRDRLKRSDPPLICCTTYTPLSHQIKTIVTKHWHVLQADTKCAELFPRLPLFTYSRSANLKDKLVHSDTFDKSHRPRERLDDMTGFFPCRNCTSCNNVHKCNTLTSFSTGKKYDIRKFITCNSINVVYVLYCPCGLQYTGCTRRQLRIRINEHRSAINRKDAKSPVARHFTETNHTVSDLKWIGIDRVFSTRRRGCTPQALLQCEAKWIFYLKTLHPKGLNDDFDLSCFL